MIIEFFSKLLKSLAFLGLSLLVLFLIFIFNTGDPYLYERYELSEASPLHYFEDDRFIIEGLHVYVTVIPLNVSNDGHTRQGPYKINLIMIDHTSSHHMDEMCGLSVQSSKGNIQRKVEKGCFKIGTSYHKTVMDSVNLDADGQEVVSVNVVYKSSAEEIPLQFVFKPKVYEGKTNFFVEGH